MKLLSYWGTTEHFSVSVYDKDGRPAASLHVDDAWADGMEGCIAADITNRMDLIDAVRHLIRELTDIDDELRKAAYYETSPFAALPLREEEEPGETDGEPVEEEEES